MSSGEVWQYDGGEFVHVGQFAPQRIDRDNWVEYQPNQQHPRQSYLFKEVFRDRSWIYLFDERRRIWVALSTSGQKCYFQWWLPENGLPKYSWELLYDTGLMCNLAPYVGIPPVSGGL